jgi:hypothetical protein
MGNQLAPFLKIGRATEVVGVVLDRFPGDEQPVTRRLFQRRSSMARQPLARLKIGAALLTPLSNSDSMPGLTSIWAISVIMFPPGCCCDAGLRV